MSFPPLGHGIHLPHVDIDHLTRDVVHGAEVAFKHVTGLKRMPAASGGTDTLRLIADSNFRTVDLEPGGKRVLILIHGILDRVFGTAFLPILCRHDFLRRAHAHYGGGVFGFDHLTLSESPLENALQLLSLIPHGAQVDIICHSRGGLVARALIEHPALADQRRAKDIQIGHVVFVGAANQGSILASKDNLPHLLSVFGAHGKDSPDHIEREISRLRRQIVTLLAGLLGARADALPGVAALVPESELIRVLNASTHTANPEVSFVRANFGGTTDPLLRHLEPLSRNGFGTTLNDLVVPFAGMANLGPRTPARLEEHVLDDTVAPQGKWYHLNYFDSPDVLEFIARRLDVP